LGDRDLAGFRSDPRAGAARRRNPRYPAILNKRRLWGDLAGSLTGTSIENLALVVWTQNMVEPGESRLAFVAAIGGAPVRERGPAWPVVAVSRDRIPRKKDC
jgi:hypothetical protein